MEVDQPDTSIGASESITRNTIFSLAVQLTTAAFTAALLLFLVRALDPHGYGIFSLALSFGLLLLVPSDFGISSSAARFVAEHRGDRAGVAGVLSDALRLKLLASTAVTVPLFALAGPIARAYGEPALVWPLRAMALAVAAQSVFLFFGSAFVAHGHARENLRLVGAESFVEVGASIALVLLGGGAAGAAFGRAIGYGVGALLALVVAGRFFGRESLSSRFDRARARRIAAYAGALALVEGAFTLYAQTDTLVIGALLSATQVGLYSAPLRFIVFLNYPGLAIANGVAPRLARSQDHEPNVDALIFGVRLLIVLQAAMLAPTIVWARPIVDLLLGSEYARSADVLRALAPFVFLSGLAPLASLAVNFLGDARRRMPIALATFVVNLVLVLALVPWIGIVGGAIASDVAYLIYVPAHLWVCRRIVHVPVRPIVVTLVRALGAATAMSLVLLAFGTHHLSVLEWIGGAILGPAAFGLVLLATGELRTLRRS